jgi:adenosylmethionine-8-amino-7-oxononanoate aminotransferase
MAEPAEKLVNDPGNIQDYIDRGLRHLWIHTAQVDELKQDDQYVIINEAKGIHLTDMAGKRYVDLLSGLWVVAAGHGRQELADVAAKQMAKMSYANPFAYASAPAIDLASKLAEITPSTINRFYFVNTGAEAVETAIRMAKQYHWNRGNQGKFKVVSRVGSYHGMTQGALSVNGGSFINRAPFEPLVPGNIPVPNTAGIGKLSNGATGLDEDFWADFTEEMIKFHRPETVAAFIAEPISTANGNHVPSPSYWRRIREICDRYDILLIADEVINGFGRTGKWFGMQHFPIEPDLMTVAKGISSGYAPIGAVMAADKVAQAFEGDIKDAFIGGSTFGAHPVSCAVALANIEIIEREGLVDNARDVGAYLQSQLKSMASGRRTIADTRGIGLMHQVDLMKDADAGVPFAPEDHLRVRLSAILRGHGLLTRGGDSIQIAPPLTITKAEVDDVIQRLDDSFVELEKDLHL